MQTIVLTTQKGGSGKSTLAISLALAAIRAGHNVRLIETDPQGTVSNWKRRRPYADADRRADLRRPRGRTAPAIARADGVTVTIVDTAGGESAATNSAIRYSDFCLIPTRPSIADIEATAATLRVIRAWHKPFAYVLNQTPIRAAARLAGAENALGDEAALDAADIVARPFDRDAQRLPGRAERRPCGLRTCAGRQVRGGNARASGSGSKRGWAMRLTATDEPVVEEFVEIPAIIPKWAALPSFDTDSASFLRTPARV